MRVTAPINGKREVVAGATGQRDTLAFAKKLVAGAGLPDAFEAGMRRAQALQERICREVEERRSKGQKTGAKNENKKAVEAKPKEYTSTVLTCDRMTKREEGIARQCTKALKRYYDHRRLQDMVKDGEIYVTVKGNEIHLYGEAECYLIPQAATECLSKWKTKDPARKNFRIINHIQIFEPEIEVLFNETDEHYNPSGWTYSSSLESYYTDCNANAMRELGCQDG